MRLAVVVLLLALAACTTGGKPAATSPTTPPPPSLTDVDTTTVAVARAAFCDRIPAEAVTAVLGRAAVKTDVWNNGDPLPGQRGGDIAHEFGCLFEAGRVSAMAHVFAPPVTVARARQLSRVLAGGKCTRWRDAPAFGKPSAGQDCTLNTGTRILGLQGLFGDAWLSCAVKVDRTGWSDQRMEDRARDWCAAVLNAARA